MTKQPIKRKTIKCLTKPTREHFRDFIENKCRSRLRYWKYYCKEHDLEDKI